MSSEYELQLAAKYWACCEAMRPLMDSPREEDAIEYERLQDEAQRLWDEMRHLKRPQHTSGYHEKREATWRASRR